MSKLNLNQKEFPVIGRIEQMDDLNNYNDDPNSKVLNAHIWLETENEFGISERRLQRITFFDKLAENASRTLEAGDYIFVNGCQARPNSFLTKRNEQVSTVDIVANRVEPVKLTKTKFDQVKEKVLAAMNAVLDTLDLTPPELVLSGAGADAGSEPKSDASPFGA
jgi:single-stranded DNA-binding protein